MDFNSGADLLVKRFDHVEVDLAGATLTWLENRTASSYPDWNLRQSCQMR